MTTIIGIKSNTGAVEGVVFGADRQLNYEGEDGELTERGSIYKLVYGKSWILGHAGGVDNDVARFQRELSQPRRYNRKEEDVESIIGQAITNYNHGQKFKEPHFIQINHLNTLSMRAERELDDLHEFILAASIYGKIDMWLIDVFGNLKQPHADSEFDYMAIGSGAERVQNYIQGLRLEDKLGATEIDIPKAVDLVVESLHQAERDPNTGGVIDLTILTAGGVESYGKLFMKAATEAIREVVDMIKEKYSPSPLSVP